MTMSKGQISTELLIIVAIVLLIFIPILVTVYFKATEANDIVQTQAQLAVSRLAYHVNSIGNLGEGSQIVSEIYIPEKVDRISFKPVGSGGEIIFTLNQSGRTSDIAQSVKFPINDFEIDSPNSGYARFIINYDSGNVNVSRVE